MTFIRHLVKASTVLALLCSVFTPATAATYFPPAPLPSWWSQANVGNVRPGIWLPCLDEWQIGDDCLQSVELFSLDGNSAGNLSYIKSPGFDPQRQVQKWRMVNTPDGKQLENVPAFVDPGDEYTMWKLPDGVTTSNGGNLVRINLMLMNSGVQLNIIAPDERNNGLPAGYYFEAKIKSQNFQKKIKWVLSNVKDPEISISNGFIVLRGLPDKSASPDGDGNVCEKNLMKAATTQLNMVVSMIYWDAGNKTTDTNPGDVVLGTNGWWCLSGFHFDPVQRQIVVNVGNVHFDEFGKEIQGWMDLKVKGSRARQWWGIDPAIAAGYAKVEVIYPGEAPRIATVVARYDQKKDLLILQANGFTYSAPKLAVSFNKRVVNKATKTLLCKKSSKVTKVTAVKPVCPKGYSVTS